VNYEKTNIPREKEKGKMKIQRTGGTQKKKRRRKSEMEVL
jgi:hypothetical protein